MSGLNEGFGLIYSICTVMYTLLFLLISPLRVCILSKYRCDCHWILSARLKLRLMVRRLRASVVRARSTASYVERHVLPSCAAEIEDGICIDQFDVQWVLKFWFLVL